MQLFNNGAAASVRLGLPVDSWNGLRNYALFVNDSYTRKRLTVNVGLRYDRYRVFLPEQERPASRFSPQAATFAAVDNVKTFNHLAPRIGMVFDLNANGKTLLKANYGRYYFNPGVTLADFREPQHSTQYTQYAWTDRNGDRLWQDGEQGAIRRSSGGRPASSIDPDLRNSYTDEISAWAERELGGQIGVRAGFVWKMDRDGYQQSNANRPISAYNVPITVVDPGPDGNRGTGDNRNVSMNNLNPANLALPVANFVTNPPGFEANYKNIELTANKRYSQQVEPDRLLPLHLGRRVRLQLLRQRRRRQHGRHQPNPVQQLREPGRLPDHRGRPRHPQRVHGLEREVLRHRGSRPGALRFTPVFKIQQGYPAGRVFNATSTSGVTGGPEAELRDAAAPRRADRFVPHGDDQAARHPRGEAVHAHGPPEAGHPARPLQRVQREHRAEHPLHDRPP